MNLENIESIALNGRKFFHEQTTLKNPHYDGYFKKQTNGILLLDKTGKAMAFVANGLRRQESPFIVTATFVEALGKVRYQMALCSIMDKFFNIVPDGEFYPNRELERNLKNDAAVAVKKLYGKVFTGIAL